MTDIVQRLRNVGGFDPLVELCSEAANEIERLRDALQFYAEGENWRDTISLGHPQIDGMTSPVKKDKGERARAALGEGK